MSTLGQMPHGSRSPPVFRRQDMIQRARLDPKLLREGWAWAPWRLGDEITGEGGGEGGFLWTEAPKTRGVQCLASDSALVCPAVESPHVPQASALRRAVGIAKSVRRVVVGPGPSSLQWIGIKQTVAGKLWK